MIHDGGFVGIAVKDKAKPKVVGNTLYGHSVPQIWTAEGAEPVIQGNRMHDDTEEGIDFWDRLPTPQSAQPEEDQAEMPQANKRARQK